MVHGYDDDDGQNDGDNWVGAAPMARQQFFSTGPPPWHMWGNTQTLQTLVETTGAVRSGITQQLIKVSYKRPETFHWLFSARLIDGPANTAAFFTRIFVKFQLIVGIGRSAIQITDDDTQPFVVRPFEEYVFQWGPVGTAFPRGAHIFTTEAVSPARDFTADGPAALGPPIKEIVAQDLQLSVQIVGLTVAGNIAAVGQPVTVEVSAQFAPKTHVRPDWYTNGSPAISFAGSEVGGR